MPMNNRKLVPTQEPGVLDFAPGAAAAYSLRNLSLSYSGPVVTVRRSTDSAEADFTASEVNDGTLAAWCGGGDGFVKQWWSQTGSNHASNSTAAQQPKVCSSGVVILEGGKPALSFDGTDDTLSIASSTAAFKFLHNGTKSAVFAVAKFGTSINPDRLSLLLGNNAGSSANVGVAIGYDDRSSASRNDRLFATITGGGSTSFDQTVNDTLPPNTQLAMSLAFAAGATPVVDRVGFRLNGARVTLGNTQVGTPSLSDATHDLMIGGTGAASSVTMLGTISELIIYPTDQTALRQRIEGNINRHFGIF